MTAQTHIEKIAQALWTVETLSRETKRKAQETREAIKALHVLLDDAQRAYQEQHPESHIVPLSGGTDKPPPSDDPVKP